MYVVISFFKFSILHMFQINTAKDYKLTGLFDS